MQRFPRRAGLCLIAGNFIHAVAVAQPADPSAAPPTQPAAVPELSPPEPLEPAEAVYPAAAREQRIEGSVLLELSIDATGTVTGANVIEAAGSGFDEAAREAALRLRFTPARRHGQPIAARIRYPYVFKLAPEAPPPPAAGALSGRVLLDGGPAASVPVELTSPATPAANQPVEVKVRGTQNEAQRLQQSAEAVNVVDTRVAKQRSSDLGEVLARTQGVAVRRNGGLGSTARFSLNGLYDDQVRFFLDGLPLDLAGYPFGIANVPVNLIERVEVYRGVVPIRFGADALGGAVNLITDQSYRDRLGVSYQVGSFGTHRVTAEGRYRHEPSGFVVGGSGYLDISKNNYKVDVDVPDERGRPVPATVPRFHDGYHAVGGNVEVGVVDRPWAKRLLLQGFATTYDKQLQNNIVMTVPYGEARYGGTVYGATAQYAVALSSQVDLELTGNYAHRDVDYVDKSPWVYDWYGQRGRMRQVLGETDTRPHDQTIWDNSGFGRGLVKWAIAPEHTVRASVTSTITRRTGDERIQSDPSARDPLTAKRNLFTLVGGVEYELSLLDERLSNIVFVKDYVYRADTEESVPGGMFRDRNTHRHTQGLGDSLRFRFTPWLLGKLSYEYATRLPRTDEVFGDGVLINANLELEPETSHNGNLGMRAELKRTGAGDFIVDINGFVRASDKLIVLLGSDRFFAYRNVYQARGLGIENALAWSSPARFVNLDGMLTWQDVRNDSDQGTFSDFKGDRIPNRPYLFSSWGGHLQIPHVLHANDSIQPFYAGRYVHAFYRGWESQGLKQFKQVVDAQVTHNIGVSWLFDSDFGLLTATVELDNLSDAHVYDNFGVQRPGRAFYVKVTGEMR